MIDNLNKYKHNYLFLFIALFFEHIFSFILLQNFTTFYHDNLDSLVVYNQVIGKIYNGEYNSAEIFLNGELSFFYLRHFFKPFVLIYSIFNTELAYYLSTILIKLIAFVSFLKFCKKFSSNTFISALCSALYASSLSFYTLGVGGAILPYLVYLICFKQKLIFKHYFIIIITGLNTDLVADFFIIPVILCIAIIIDYEKLKKNIIKNLSILFIFYFFSIFSSLNLFYVFFFEEPIHRVEFFNKKDTFFINLFNQFINFFKLPKNLDLNWTFVKNLPLNILIFLGVFYSMIINDKKAYKFLLLIIWINLFEVISNTFGNLFFGMRFSWLGIYESGLFVFLIFFLSIKSITSNKKYLINLSFVTLILFQLNSSIVPFIKKYIIKIPNYRNVYTFEGYYMFNDYKKIKEMTQGKRVMTIGYDPLIAVMNDISVIDGYHAIYPLDYKKKFRKIISKELKKNKDLQNYYDNWGSRVYAFYDNSNNIEIDYLEAKNLGADFIISKYKLDNNNLLIMPIKFTNEIFLYQIKN